MRLILLCALVASAAFAATKSSRLHWQPEPLESVESEEFYRPGYEYVYHAHGQIATGLTVPGSQQSISQYVSKVVLVFKDEKTVFLQIPEIRVGSAQQEISDLNKKQPFDILEEVELSQEQQEMLQKPIVFRYENGLVSEIEFDREENEWSKNLKRSVLNLIQINLQKKNAVETRFEKDSLKEEKTYFNAVERMLEGECEVAYTLIPTPKSSEQSPELRISKAVNFEKCPVRVGARYNFRFGDECPSCENKFTGAERNIESSTVATLRVVRPSEHRFLIREAELLSTYTYQPLNQEEAFFTTKMQSRMVLVEVTKAQRQLAQPRAEEKETLLYSTKDEQAWERFISEGREDNLPFYAEIKNKHELVSRLVKAVIAKSFSVEKGVEAVATHEMARLVQVLRLCTKQEIARIHKEVCESSEFEPSVKEHIKSVMHDALALAGTYNTVEHLAEKIRARAISPAKTAVVFKHLVSSVSMPSEKLLSNVLLPLCKELRNSPVERQSCWLTLGALMKGVCGEHRDQLASESTPQQPKTCPRALKQKFVSELFQQLEKAESRYEKILALKTIANAAIDISVLPLEKIIRDEREEKTVRIQAIDALRQLRFVMPHKIQAVLMPLFKNTREHPEIRIAAFHQIMQTLPERVVIDQLAAQLNKEPSTQVAAFVYSYLVRLTKTEIPCEKRVAEDVKASLQLARVQPQKWMESVYGQAAYYAPEQFSGASLNWAAVFANDSVLPKEVMAKFETVFAGQWNKYLGQIGFQQHNLDRILYKIIEKVEQEGIQEIVVRGKRATSFKPAEMLRSLFSKLSIKSRRGHEESDPHAMAYVRFRDLDFALLPMDEETIPEMIRSVVRNGRVELSDIEAFLAKGYRFSTTFSTFVYSRTRQVITSFGLPLSIRSEMPTIVRVQGLVQAELAPRDGRSIEGLRLRVNAQPSLASTHVTKMEILSPLVNHGVKLLHTATLNLPFDVTSELSWKDEWKMETKMALPKENKRLVQLHSRPVTFVRVWPKETRMYVEPKEKTIFVEQLETQTKKVELSQWEDKLEQATGIKLSVEGHYYPHMFNKATERLPNAFLIGENHVEIAYEKTEQTPKEYIWKVQASSFTEQDSLQPSESFGRFYEKDTEEHFELESSEWEPKQPSEEERRREFSTYVKAYKSGKAYQHRIVSELFSVGGAAQKKARMEARFVCDEKARHCVVEVDAKRTPIGEERKEWTLKSAVKVLYPEMPETLYELLEQKHRELTAEITAEWGCEEKSQMNVKVQGEQNKQQKRWMQKATELKKKLAEKQSLTALEEYSMLVEAAMLNQYKVIAKYNIRSPYYALAMDKLYAILKTYSPLFSSELQFAKNEPRTIRAIFSVEPETRQFVNLTLETPSERFAVRDFRLPLPLRLANIRRQPSTPIRSLRQIGSFLSEPVKAECTVESRKVNTFDEVVYRAPLTTCYSVLAKDCSSEQPEFVVMMKKISPKAEEKKCKIVTEKVVIEMEKQPEWEEVKVLVNGEEIKTAERLESFGIFKIGKELVKVEIEQVKVTFDGYTAQIKVSEYFKNKQCGLCGHYDGEQTNDFRRADNEETENMEEFHRSFLVKHEECDMEEEKLQKKENYRLLSQESSSSEESVFEFEEKNKSEKKEKNERKYYSKRVYSEEPEYKKENEIVEPEQKTRVIEENNKICFSKQPVPECPRKTYENDEDLKEIKIKYSCLPRSSVQASRLLRESRYEILSLEHLPESFSETLRVPKTCIVY